MSVRKIGSWTAGGLAAVVLVWAPAALRAQSDCVSAPDEPSPLPTVHADDPNAAAFAARRMIQLARRARRLEARAPDEARAVWRRVLCFDPDDPSARAAVGARNVKPPEDPAAAAAVPVTVARTPIPAAAEPAEIADPIAPAEDALRAARFTEAVAEADAIRAALPATGDAATRALRVRIEIVAASAQVGLGDREAASAAIGRALDADPVLTLDEASVSPRVVQIWREVVAARPAQDAEARTPR